MSYRGYLSTALLVKAHFHSRTAPLQLAFGIRCRELNAGEVLLIHSIHSIRLHRLSESETSRAACKHVMDVRQPSEPKVYETCFRDGIVNISLVNSVLDLQLGYRSVGAK